MKEKIKIICIAAACFICCVSQIEVKAWTKYDCSQGVHQYRAEVITEPLEDTDGLRRYTCVRCQYTYTESIPMYGHNFSEWKIEREPGCESEGLKYRVCQNHWHDTVRQEEKIPPAGHDYGGWIVDRKPTEKEEGHCYKKCSKDEAHIIEKKIPRLLPKHELTPVDVILVGTDTGVLLIFLIFIYSDIRVMLWAKRIRKEIIRKWKEGEPLYGE